MAATGAACGSGSDKPKADRAKAEGSTAKGDRTLRIAQWGHLVPAYDDWFDNDYTKRWGDQHDVEVVVDHLPFAQLRNRADVEVAAQRGHDIFGFVSPPPIYEDEVIDHREIIEEVEGKAGRMTPLVERGVLNPKTAKYFGFPAFWVANPALYRIDLWERAEPGLRPDTWDDVVRAGPKLKAMDHPVGIGMAPDIDHAQCLPALLYAYGSSIQDEAGNLTINRPATVEAVKVGTAIFEGGMTEEVFGWDGASDNRYLASGRASLIIDAISAIRAAEKQDPGLASQIALASIPGGPAARLSPPSVQSVYVIWNFSRNEELAKQFLVDHALNYREAFLRSEFYNLPGFPGTVPDLQELVANEPRAQPSDKYALLADATSWSTGLGHPGHHTAAIDDVTNQYLIPQMFAAAARGEMSAEDAVKRAESEMQPIFAKWKERGKI
ncbi:MAG: extracellular solute-binding protein [Actinomycetota bacterium]|nr:extracellular solute-binding protein [Actinomycetota bacterium]